MLATCDQQARRRATLNKGSCSSPQHESFHLPSNAPRARFATVMMMSPDYPLHTFIQEDFSMLRRMCCTITLYARYECPLSAL
jgi:hypothetical protein